jgi:hypothetical protein
MAERYMAAWMILFDKLNDFQKEKIEQNKDKYRCRDFAREVIRMAESEEENVVNEVDAFVVSMRLTMNAKTPNNKAERKPLPTAEEMQEAADQMGIEERPFKFN